MEKDITTVDNQSLQMIRENTSAWRVEDGALYIAALPGTLWGKDHNDAQNIRLYPKPDLVNGQAGIMLEVYIESEPEKNAEQAGLIIYGDDDHYVKFVKEMVDHKHVVVMAVEVDGKASVHANVPIHTDHIGLRITMQDQVIYGAFKELDSDDWQQLEPIAVPSLTEWLPGLFAHGGDESTMRYGKFTNLSISAVPSA